MIIKYNNHLLYECDFEGDEDICFDFCKDSKKRFIVTLDLTLEYDINIKFFFNKKEIFMVLIEDGSKNFYQIYVSSFDNAYRRINLESYKYREFINTVHNIINSYRKLKC